MPSSRFALVSLASLVIAGALAGACGSGPSLGGVRGAAGLPASPASPPARCGGAPASSPAVFASPSRQSSGVALVRAGDALLALVADRLARRVDVVDVARKELVRSIDVAGEPSQILALADGRLAASLADRSAIQILDFDGAKGAAVDACVIEVPRGPAGLAVSEDGATLAVVGSLDHEVSLFDTRTMATKRVANVDRSPVAVVIEDGRAFVSHVTGDGLSVIDLAGDASVRTAPFAILAASEIAPEEELRKERRNVQAFSLVAVSTRGPEAGGGEAPPVSGMAPGATNPPRATARIFVPEVSVDPGSLEIRSTYYGPPPVAGITKEMPVVVAVDAASEKPRIDTLISQSERTFADECMLPRGVAARESNARLYVACRGIDELLELDANALDPMRDVLDRIQLSKGTTGVAVDDTAGIAVSFGEFDAKLDVMTLADHRRATVDLSAGGPALSASYREGRELFYRTDDARITADGVGCASCHPDGMDDGLTWSTPDGQRQTPMLAGRVHGTEPYGWNREMDTLPKYIVSTVQRLGGQGLPDAEVVALASYLERMDAPPREATTERERRAGEVAFETAGCAGCHADAGLGTDHESHAAAARTDEPFDTPSLAFVGLTAPYFHDGRYRTLDDVLSDRSSTMGTTANLSDGQRALIVRYLESL